ncbi:hypothetical protein CA600_28520 [Paenibacillus sp. VTT E-133280]|uniref:hypothetical protein n=1 Tax=unclassified Paenibacillus TaxID=185978 RepID=UPI000B9FA7BF|nr:MULTISPECIES: hypothetical protein [unclassified Paenibacillus]MDH6373002.1 hypothetical protein [Paenibacillus sp. PastF-3]OZQ60338.1 hypothetical protein CA600_28520 [Paenibacillus sp. VTT E-133280]
MTSWMVATIFYVFMACWSFGFIYRYRCNLTSTITMISPMVSGMIIGFGGGTIAGLLLSHNLLLSLFICVLIGMIAGGSIGAIISIGAFLNGALSGMMAGMTGAMLINMLPTSQWSQSILAFMVISGIFQFVHLLMLQGQIEEKILSQSPWIYRSPALMLIVTVILLSIHITFERKEASLIDSRSAPKPEHIQQPFDKSKSSGHRMSH